MIGNKKKLNGFLLGTSVFFIPLWPTVTPFFWVLVIFIFILSKQFSISQFKFNSFLLLFLSFYLLHVVGMFWTSDWNSGLRDLRIKLPMLIFPILFSFYQPSAKTYSLIWKGLIIGCVTASIICIALAINRYIANYDLTEFFYIQFSRLIPPGYFSLCLNLSILFLVSHSFNKKNNNIRIIQYRNAALILFFILIIILLSAKMSIITVIITTSFLVLFEASKHKIFLKVSKLFTVSFILFLIAFYGYLKTYNRFNQTMIAVQQYDPLNKPMPDSYYNSSTIRLTEWKYGFEIFKQNWLIGVGTGDIKSITMAHYIKNKFSYGITHFETPASQYLHHGMILGIIGLLFLLLNYFYPFLISIRHKDYLYASFLMIIIMYSTTGNVFSAASVLIYGLFNSLFAVKPTD